MLLLAVLAVALLTVRPAGGRFETLAGIPLRGAALVVLALALQVLTISVLRDPPQLLAGSLHVGSYALAAAFLWVNRRLPGLLLLSSGGALNLVAILANAGTMPARPGALRLAGIVRDGDHFANSGALTHPHLALLGDVFAVPRSAGLLANVFSVGDVLLALGAVWLVHAAAGCRWTAARPPAAPLGTAVAPT